MRVAVFISGRGSNMAALVASAAKASEVDIVGVLSSRPEAAGLAVAREKGIATAALDHKAYDSREAFERAIEAAVAPWRPELICLAGFMRKLSPYLLQRYANRILNIHPSLLPSFKGLHAHEQAIAAGVRIHGCSVHIVSEGLDEGPILAQAAIPVSPGDTAATLASRLIAVEHQLYPATVQAIADGRISLDGTAATAPVIANDQMLISV